MPVALPEWGTLRDDGSVAVNVLQAAMDYDAATASDKRKAPSGKIVREEVMLTQKKREVVTAGVRDLSRNLSVLSWAARKHLDYNTQFNLQSQSGYEDFDAEFEKFFEEISRPENCDVAGRYGFGSMLRMIEMSAILDGDCGVLKLATGHVQGIESDLVRNPEKAEGSWFNGVLTDRANRPVSYGLWRRGEKGSGYEYDRTVPAENMYLHGYFGRFDQCRGVSPLTAAANDFQDLYEGKDLILAKIKVQSFFAVSFFRDSPESVGQVTGGSEDEDGNEVDKAGYKIDFGKGPAAVDLNDDDRMEFHEGSTPAASTQDFLMLVCQIAIKALDLPFSFFDESFTNFFGSRAAWLHYERSCHEKRGNLIRFANDWLRWKVAIAIKSGRLKVPPSVLADAGEGMIHPWWEFIPRGVPWWDPSKEIDGSVKAVQEGLSSRQKVCRETDSDFFENIRQRKIEEDYARKMGVKLGDGTDAPSGTAAPEATLDGSDPDKTPAVDGDAVAAPGGDVQAAALNGAQVTSLLLIADSLSLKKIPIEAARALIKASFPATSDDLINTIVTSISVHERPAAEPIVSPQNAEKKAPADADGSGDESDGSEAGKPADS